MTPRQARDVLAAGVGEVDVQLVCVCRCQCHRQPAKCLHHIDLLTGDCTMGCRTAPYCDPFIPSDYPGEALR